jgi:syntaxin 18
MTDAERDQIDSDAQNIIKTCRETIGHFRQEAERQKVHPQVKEHRAVVIFLIDAYLKGEEFFFFVFVVVVAVVVVFK